MQVQIVCLEEDLFSLTFDDEAFREIQLLTTEQVLALCQPSYARTAAEAFLEEVQRGAMVTS